MTKKKLVEEMKQSIADIDRLSIMLIESPKEHDAELGLAIQDVLGELQNLVEEL